MPRSKWNVRAITGHAQIDAEHDACLKKIDALWLLLEANTPRAMLVSSLRELSQCVCVHFAHEEQLMQQSLFPSYNNHAFLHGRFKYDFEHSINLLADGHIDSESVLQSLDEWVGMHLAGEDRRLAEYLEKTASSASNVPTSSELQSVSGGGK